MAGTPHPPRTGKVMLAVLGALHRNGDLTKAQLVDMISSRGTPRPNVHRAFKSCLTAGLIQPASPWPGGPYVLTTAGEDLWYALIPEK